MPTIKIDGDPTKKRRLINEIKGKLHNVNQFGGVISAIKHKEQVLIDELHSSSLEWLLTLILREGIQTGKNVNSIAQTGIYLRLPHILFLELKKMQSLSNGTYIVRRHKPNPTQKRHSSSQYY
jgi:hypothetical protein